MAVYIILIFCVFIVVMTTLLNFIKRDRIKLIGDFFAKVIPTIPFTGIAKLWIDFKKRSSNKI